MSDLMSHIQQATDYILSQGITEPEVGIVLGTGLGRLVESIEVLVEIPYETIPHFPVATVEFHSGKLIFGVMSGKKVLAMQGRFHHYEGYNFQQVTFPIRVMKGCGIRKLLFSNAAGTMNLGFKKGELMLIDDHINMLPGNPLIGPNIEELGARFPDMSQPYSGEINEKMKKVAEERSIPLHQGTYVAVAGPMLETRAEYRMLNRLGADVVGMSTVPEVIVANHMGMPCGAVSVITDECDPDNLAPVDIEDIIEVADKAEEKLVDLFKALILEL